MQPLLLLIPILVLFVLWDGILRWGWAESPGGAFLRAATMWGLIACFMVEALSPFHALTPAGLAGGWLTVGAVITVGRLAHPGGNGLELHWPRWPRATVDRLAVICVVLVLAVTALVAWLSPPQTWDSLNYHLPRVAHWAQQASVQHFATGIEVQNSRPPGAEFLQLHVYVLTGGDRVLPLFNWAVFLMAIVAVTVIARRWIPRHSLTAAAILATIPMVIIQASSTVNDIVVGLWVMVFAWDVLRVGRETTHGRDVFFAGSAAGLALLTKPTAFAYVVPLSLWALLRLVRAPRSQGLITGAALAVLVITTLNAPYMERNRRTYGSAFDPAQVEIHSNQIRTPAVLVSNTLRNLALNASTPIPWFNKGVFLAVAQIHKWMGISQNDPRTTAHEPFRVHSFSTHEERSGNTLHTILIGVVLIWLIRRQRELPPGVTGWVLSSLAAFLAISLLFQWQIFGSRYQLPFFMLLSPVLAFFVVSVRRELGWVLIGLLFLGSLPWLVSIRSRPLLPIPGQASAPSVLSGDRQALYFTNGEYLQRPYTELTSRIIDEGCLSVGVSISGSSAEYLLWELMGAPGSAAELEWIVANTPSARYLPEDFEPCAVICQDCEERVDSFRGLPKVQQMGNYALFLSKDG
jgi:hypothetical protein